MAKLNLSDLETSVAQTKKPRAGYGIGRLAIVERRGMMAGRFMDADRTRRTLLIKVVAVNEAQAGAKITMTNGDIQLLPEDRIPVEAGEVVEIPGGCFKFIGEYADVGLVYFVLHQVLAIDEAHSQADFTYEKDSKVKEKLAAQAKTNKEAEEKALKEAKEKAEKDAKKKPEEKKADPPTVTETAQTAAAAATQQAAETGKPATTSVVTTATATAMPGQVAVVTESTEQMATAQTPAKGVTAKEATKSGG